MGAIGEIRLTPMVQDPDGNTIPYPPTSTRFAAGAGDRGDIRKVSLTGSAFTALTVPSGSKAVVIYLPATAVSLTLKGITGDSGIAITPASNALGLPVVLPLGSSPSIGITNGGGTVSVDVLFL